MKTETRRLFSVLRETLRGGPSSPAAASDPLCSTPAPQGWSAGLRLLHPVVRAHRLLFFSGSLCLAASIAAALFPPLFARDLVDEVILGGEIERLAPVLLGLALLYGAERSLRLAEEFFFALCERRMLRDVEERLLRAVERLPRDVRDRRLSGYLARRVAEDVEGLRPLLSGLPARTAGQALRLLGGAALLFTLEWRIALVAFLFFPALAFLLRRASRGFHALSHRRLEDQAQAAGLIQETIALFDHLQSRAAASSRRRAMLAAFERQLDSACLLTLLASVTALLIRSIPALARGLALAAGAVLIHRGEWTAGGLVAFQGYLGHCFGPAQHLATVQLEFERARAALERLGALVGAARRRGEGGLAPRRLRGEIECRGVGFAYGQGPPVLREVSFRVEPGGALAVLGPSGIGKTTLLTLLRRLYAPTAGEILFDGRPACDYDPAFLRERIGFLPQEVRLIAGTVLENLSLDRPQAAPEEIVEAACAAGVHEEILALPAGYATRLGEGGSGLSAGQRQRLALARALLSDPDILLLDEPTAFLDERSEEQVLAALRRQRERRTLILATHRPSTARICGEVILLGRRGAETGKGPATPVHAPGTPFVG